MQGWDWSGSRCGDSRPVFKEELVPHFVFNASNHQIDLNLHVPQAISRAIDAANKVCRRDHIKAVDRIQRTGIFVTELRRNLGDVPLEPKRVKMLIDGMCSPSQWSDVGQYDTRAYFHGNELVMKDRIIEWMGIAETMTPEDIESDTRALFDELNGSLRSFDALVSRAREINSEADRVLGGLASLAEQNA